MKKFSDLVNENDSNKPFKFQATVVVEGTVYADSEGSAGELADKEMDEIPGMVSYELINIQEEVPSEGFKYQDPDLAITEGAIDIVNELDKVKNSINMSIMMLNTKKDKTELVNAIKKYLAMIIDINILDETKIATNEDNDIKDNDIEDNDIEDNDIEDNDIV
jgi:hypothetical protein